MILLSKYFFQRPPKIFRDVCEVVMTSSHSAEAMTAAPDLIQVAEYIKLHQVLEKFDEYVVKFLEK